MQNVIQVGAFGSDDGKTTVACDIIREIAKTTQVIGVKIVCVDEHHSSCHKHSGQGCGICSSLKKDYEWTLETNEVGEKDTVKMKRAGAKQAFLLKCKEPYLKEAFFSFLEQEIPDDVVLVCESNRLRLYLKPAAFIFVARQWPYLDKKKPHADKLAGLADRIFVRGDALSRWDIQTDEMGCASVRVIE